MRFRHHTALMLIPLLLWSSGSLAQQPAAAPAGGLKIIVVTGDGVRNDIRQRSSRPLVVKVVDQNDQPVSGAEVVLQAPAAGPGGRFYEWLQAQTLKTDAEGLARAQAFTPNTELGPWQMRVLAQHGARQATAVLSQTNVSRDGAMSNGKSRKGLWIALGLIGAAVAVGFGVAAARNGDTTAAAPGRPVVVAPGPITVGGPR